MKNFGRLLAVMVYLQVIISLSSGAFAQPVITSFSPVSSTPGTLVTVSGTALSNPTAFTIGGKAAIVISNDGSSLVGMVMPVATTGNISITTSGGTITSTGNFKFSPSSLLSTAQQGGKLFGTGGSNMARSVSISTDGSTPITGGLNDNSNIGADMIFLC